MKYKNQKYLDWLKTQNCVVCGRTPCDPAHQPSQWNGVSLKSPDTYCLPLCRECHDKEHRVGHTTFWGQELRRETDKYIIHVAIHSMCLAHFTRFLSEQK